MNKNSKFIKNLSGHSGCIVTLEKENDIVYVLKKSSSEAYNQRLKRQMKKQDAFVNSENVRSPKIINSGYTSNIFFFAMEYIKGKTLAEYTSEIRILEISEFIKCLFKSLYYETSKVDPRSNEIFYKKIINLENNIKNQNKIVQEAFEILKSFNWNCVYKSFCHGDLTLENILIGPDKKLYLIDFLDSFYNSWMIDIAKLLQDLELKWSFRNLEISPNRNLRLQVAKEALIEEILSTSNGKQNLQTIYHILLLNILRIIPYTSDSKTFEYLDWAMSLLINKLNQNKIGVCL